MIFIYLHGDLIGTSLYIKPLGICGSFVIVLGGLVRSVKTDPDLKAQIRTFGY